MQGMQEWAQTQTDTSDIDTNSPETEQPETIE